MAVVILSPHLDDAVLSCWHVLTQSDDVTVINVFAGVPEGLAQPAWWDRYTGAIDSEQRVRERLEEDVRALALAGRAPINLDLLDEQYRNGAQPLAPVTARLDGLLPRRARIYAPAALSTHADHALVRGVALELRAAGFAVSLYADLPHATAHGWPAWVTEPGIAVSDDHVAAAWTHTLAKTGLRPDEMAATVHELAPSAHAKKLDAVRTYRTQLEGLAEMAGGRLADPALLGYEVSWALPSRARREPPFASRSAAPRP